MNVLFVSDVSISKATSGAERVLFEQSTILQKRGNVVHVLTRKLPEHKSNNEIIQGVNEWRYDVNQKNIPSFSKSIFFDCKKLFEVLQDRFSFDVINFHQPFSAFGVIRSSASQKIKKIYTCHSLSFQEFQSRNPKPRNIIKKVLYSFNIEIRRFIERRALRKSDTVVVLSRFTQEKLQRIYKISVEKITIIPGGVDLERFHPAAERTKIRQRLSIPKEKMILLTVRDLEPRMGLKNLIYAVKKVRLELPDICLVLGGQGPLDADLKSLVRTLGVEDCVKFTGFIPEELLSDYYRMADIFILPTLELEGFGLITLEALASGVPVLGTPVGGTIEILSRLNPRYLFKDTEPESMAELIIKTCQEFKVNPMLWQDVSSQCRLFVEENYSWEKNVDKLENMFREIVGS
ncbi:MAG: glycosyltransferase family 4 protein [Candidatus Cloacimonadales bacterium]|nr:glycosyltransferase family 4 protein [Candidatus Cloacimonadales bacterium]